MYCDQCGAQMPAEARFCAKCGVPVSSASNEGKDDAFGFASPPRNEYYAKSERPRQNSYSASDDDYDELARPLRTGEFAVMMLLMLVPVGNLIFLILWAFDRHVNQNKRNWAKAMLIFMCIGIVLSIIAGIVIAAVAASIMSSYPYYF